ncbi:MAG: hypothetical protein Q9192_001070 [Flavoplaca navasiana]
MQRQLCIGVLAFGLGLVLPMAHVAYRLGSEPDLAKEDPRTVSKVGSVFQPVLQQLILTIWLLVWVGLYSLDRLRNSPIPAILPPSFSPEHDLADPPQPPDLASDALESRRQVGLDSTSVDQIDSYSLDDTRVSDSFYPAKVWPTRGRRPSASAEASQLRDRDPTPTPNVPTSHTPGPQAEASNTLRSFQTPTSRQLLPDDSFRPKRKNLKYSDGTESTSIPLESSVQPRAPERGFRPRHLTSGPPLPDTKSSYGPRMSSEVKPASSWKTIGQLVQVLVNEKVLSREEEALIHVSPLERLPQGKLVPKIELWEAACRERRAPQVLDAIQVFGTERSFHHDFITLVGNFELWNYFGWQSNGLPMGYNEDLARLPTLAYVRSGGDATPKSVDTAY